MATVLTDEGRSTIIHRIKGTAGWDMPEYIGWGTVAGTAAVANTTLFTEASESRVQATTTVETQDNADDTYQAIGTLTADGTKTITNAGLFDVSDKTDGNDKLFIKGDFTGIGLEADDSIQFTFKYKHS